MSFFEMLVEYAPLFIEASWVTLRLTAVALAIALVLGAVIAAAAIGQLVGTAGAARLPERASRPLSVLALIGHFVAIMASKRVRG